MKNNMYYEPMHSCQDVTDEPCDACICEEEEKEETGSIVGKEFKKNYPDIKNIKDEDIIFNVGNKLKILRKI